MGAAEGRGAARRKSAAWRLRRTGLCREWVQSQLLPEWQVVESPSDSASGCGLQHSGLMGIFVFLWWAEWKLRACCSLAAQELWLGAGNSRIRAMQQPVGGGLDLYGLLGTLPAEA